MEETTTAPSSLEKGWTSRGKYILLGMGILLVILAGFLAYGVWTNQGSNPDGSDLVSASELEEQYGLRVRLIGVTAGGGMIDFRLKILEPEKARQFLQNPANLPISMVTESGTKVLAADSMEDDIKWEEGGVLFIMLPNSGGAIEPGTPVSVEFGNVQLEPVPAQ
jgi:hypothetical protein